MGIGAPELIIVLVVVLLLFGSTRLPKLARSLDQASKEFKRGVTDSSDSDDRQRNEPEAIDAKDTAIEAKDIAAKDTKDTRKPA